MNGAELIAAERERQVSQEGWYAEHDDEHEYGEMAMAAICYASEKPLKWPWDKKWDKRKKHNRIRRLVIAGALLAAEIDRLRRKADLEGT